MPVILLDPRSGSADLVHYFRPKTMATVSPRNIPADATFRGKGPGGKPVSIGIEVKKLPDFLSCIQNGRFSGHQLIEMYDRFDFNFMIVEGLFRENLESGQLEVWRQGGWKGPGDAPGGRGWMWTAVDNWINTIGIIAGVRFKFTKNREHTALVIKNLWHWFNDKEWSEHRSHLKADDSQMPLLLAKPTYAWRMMAQLPAVSESAVAFEAAFGTMDKLIHAGVEDLAKVKIGRAGKKQRQFGKSSAERVWKALHEKGFKG